MKNAKKIMSLILASALVMSLSACQSGNSKSAETTAAGGIGSSTCFIGTEDDL